jgi:hypothetical protein
MTTLSGSILATFLAAQLQGGTIQGKVVDDQGKPVPDAQVVYYAPRPWLGIGEPVEVATKTDAEGQFRVASPAVKRGAFLQFWAYRPGSALALTRSRTPPFDLVLRKPQPRIVKVESSDGQPVPGARLAPQMISSAGRATRDELPETLATPPSSPDRMARQRSTTWRAATSWLPYGSRPRRSVLRTCS